MRASTSTATTDVGATTIGRANSACALIGTTHRASTPGHTIGPPALKLYAVEPVGVAQHDAVAAPAGQGASVDLDHHLEHPLAGCLLDAGLVDREAAGDQLTVAEYLHVQGEPVLDRCSGG